MQQRLCHSKPVTFTCISAPCKGIQDSLEFWIPHGGFRIPGTGFQSLPVEFGSRLQSLVGPWAVFRIPKPRIQDSTSTFSQILDPRSKTFLIPESGFRYMRRCLWKIDQSQGENQTKPYNYSTDPTFPRFYRLFFVTWWQMEGLVLSDTSRPRWYLPYDFSVARKHNEVNKVNLLSVFSSFLEACLMWIIKPRR